MKSFILATVSSVALLAAGAAFAADPVAPVAAIDQIGAGGANANMSSLIDQSGVNNTASTTQSGSTNASSVVLQTSGSINDPKGPTFNTATVNQSGSNGARALVVQTVSGNATQNPANSATSGQTANVTQAGTNEAAFVYQNIDNPFGDAATINQASSNTPHNTGNLFGVNGRSQAAAADTAAQGAQALTGATLDAWATAGSGTYGATVVELGRVEKGTISQQGGDNAALITTAGDGTTGTISQYSTASNDAAAIRQDGVDNGATGTITQGGQYESASVEQLNGGFRGGVNTVGTINQYAGYGQVARITQSGVGPGESALINQYAGSTNSFARTTQDSTLGGNMADTEQNGVNGYAVTTQLGSTSTANVSQSGANDTSTVNQNDSTFAGANVAAVSQSGNNEWSKVIQLGGSNTATLNQYGTSDVSSVAQTGSVNGANVYQAGYAAYSSVIQNGQNNSATVRQ